MALSKDVNMLFDQFKQLVSIATTSADFKAKNAVMQDTTFAGLVANNVATLTKDFNIKLNTTNVLSVTGLASSDVLTKEIKFTPKGTEKLIQGFVERNIQNPNKIWVRPNATDGRRYVINDSIRGVLFAGSNGEIVGALPGFGTAYVNATSVITFTVSSVEYIAVAMPTHNAVRIFRMSTFSTVSTIGVYGTPGLPGTGLHTPTDLAFDPTTSTLYICSDTGVGTGGTAPGYIVSYNLTTPATPVFGSFIAVNAGGSLLHGQVNAPMYINFDPVKNALWVATDTGGTPEIGALAVTGLTSPGYLVGYLETRGTDYDMLQVTGLWFGSNKIFAISPISLEVFDTVTYKHIRSYGTFATEDSSTVTSADVNLDFSLLSSIAFDTVTVDGTSVTTIIVGDTGNRRIIRFSENTFDNDSYVTFAANTFSVPVSIQGYVLQGTLVNTNVVVEYRTSDTGNWQELSTIDSVPGSLYLQFRLRLRLNSKDSVKTLTLKQVVIIGELA
jgi:hypothetical protein